MTDHTDLFEDVTQPLPALPSVVVGRRTHRGAALRSISQPTRLFATTTTTTTSTTISNPSTTTGPNPTTTPRRNHLLKTLSLRHLDQSPPRSSSPPPGNRFVLTNTNDAYSLHDNTATQQGIPELWHEYQYYQDLTRSVTQASHEWKEWVHRQTASVRRTALVAALWMLLVLTTSITFFVHYGNLTIPNAMLFAIYTVTTAGFGSVKIPHTNGFLLAVMAYIYISLASLTILVATLYQWTSWEAHLAKKHTQSTTTTPSTTASTTTVLVTRLKTWFRTSEVGRAVITGTYLITLLGIGTITMVFLEDWNVAQALYFATYVMTTVGYGSPIAPTNLASTLFCVFYVPFNISFFSIYMGTLGRYYYMLTAWNTRRLTRSYELAQQHEQQEQETTTKDADHTTSNTATNTESPHRKLETTKDLLDFVLANMSMDDEDVPSTTPTPQRGTPAATQAQHETTLRQWLHFLPSQAVTTSTSNNNNSKSTTTRLTQSLQQPVLPSLPLVLLVQERMAHIIASEVANQVSPCTLESESTVSVTFENMNRVLDKWCIPVGPVRQAFRVSALEALVVVGEHRLLTQGADAIFGMKPLQVLGIFAPLLAAMGNAGIMEAWLARTEQLAATYFPRVNDEVV